MGCIITQAGAPWSQNLSVGSALQPMIGFALANSSLQFQTLHWNYCALLPLRTHCPGQLVGIPREHTCSRTV